MIGKEVNAFAQATTCGRKRPHRAQESNHLWALPQRAACLIAGLSAM